MSRHKTAVVGVEHFRNGNDEVVLLNEFIRDPEIIDNVPALWVPKDVLDDRDRATHISQIASSAPEYTNAKGYKKDRKTFELIFDTSSSGGVDATLEHIDYIASHHPAPKMTFCINPSAYSETFTALQKYRENKKRKDIDISFLLAAPYPENDIEKVEKLEGESIEEYVGRLSLNAERYGMGMVGAADLAKYTLVGQPYVALGICVNGAVDYEVTNQLVPDFSYIKRLTSPEDTYEYATNTAAHVGRTLFDKGNNKFLFPYEDTAPHEDVLTLVKHNFLKLIGCLNELPPAKELPEGAYLEEHSVEIAC